MSPAGPVSGRFPDFPWDTLAAAKERAAAHPGGLVDLSIGTPVDPVPEVARTALLQAADAHGYPTVLGPAAVRRVVADWLERRAGAVDVADDEVLLSIGSKELIANLAVQLGLGPGDVVVHPELAYPTYDVAARFAGAMAVASDEPESVPGAALVFLNSPANPHGAVADPDRLREIVTWARAHDVLVVSDECYLEFGWEVDPVSVLDPRVCGDSHDGVLALQSASKRSNLAGYRGAFVAGDRRVVGELLAVRKHLGFMVPTPVQQAVAAVFSDDTHATEQVERYRARRAVLRPALESAGYRIDHSEAGLYLWATRDEPCRTTIDRLAEHGVLAAPGDFYGAAGAQHVRIALTASDADIAAVADRLA